MALFMYPHSVTASLSSNSRNTIRRNAAILPAYSFVLGLLALLGWVAIAAGTQPIGLDGEPNAQLVIPQLFEDMFPAWFAGVAFAAIAIGALVPAAIMSIAAANTFSRNIYKEWLNKDATPAQEAKVSKLMSLLVKAFALVFVLTLDKQNAINFQLLGGIWILQTFPAVVFSLFTRWFHRYALLVGWAVGMVYGTVEAYQVINPVTGKHFGGSLGMIPGIGEMGYIAMTAFVHQRRARGRAQRDPQRDEGVQRRATRPSRSTTSPTPTTRACRRTSPSTTRTTTRTATRTTSRATRRRASGVRHHPPSPRAVRSALPITRSSCAPLGRVGATTRRRRWLTASS